MEGTATIVGVRIKDLNDSARVWDTLPETNNGLVGVTEKDSGLLNKSDGSLSHSVQGETLLSLWVEEKGDMKKQISTYHLSIKQRQSSGKGHAQGGQNRKNTPCRQIDG